MKSRIVFTLIAMLLTSAATWAQYNEVLLPENVTASGDLNTTTPATIDQYNNPVDIFRTSKNEVNLFSSATTVGASAMASKYLSIYNIPISHSRKMKLFFRSNTEAYENLAIKAVIPVVHKMFEYMNKEYTATGIGDAILNLNYTLKVKSTFLTLGINSKIPTAKKKNMVKGFDIPLGTGSTDFGFSLFCSKTMVNNITARASANYNVRTSADYYGVTYDYGNTMSALIGGDFFIKKINVGADFNFTSAAENKFKVGSNPASKGTGFTSIDAIPYVRFNITEDITGTLNAYIPVISKWTNAPDGLPDPERKIKFGLAFAYKFVKSEEGAK